MKWLENRSGQGFPPYNLVYDFEKHNGQVALLERPLFVPKNFVCLLNERVETFYNEQKVSIKIII